MSCTTWSCAFDVGGIGRAGKQVDQPLLRWRVAGRPGGGEQQFDAVAAGVEQVAIVLDLREAGDRCRRMSHRPCRPGWLPWRDEDLPQSDQRLEGAGDVGAQQRIAILLMAAAVSRNWMMDLSRERCAIR